MLFGAVSAPAQHTLAAKFDLTKPLHTHGKDFNRAPFPAVDLSRFLK